MIDQILSTCCRTHVDILLKVNFKYYFIFDIFWRYGEKPLPLVFQTYHLKTNNEQSINLINLFRSWKRISSRLRSKLLRRFMDWKPVIPHTLDERRWPREWLSPGTWCRLKIDLSSTFQLHSKERCVEKKSTICLLLVDYVMAKVDCSSTTCRNLILYLKHSHFLTSSKMWSALLCWSIQLTSP